jgi:hypothetical protein
MCHGCASRKHCVLPTAAPAGGAQASCVPCCGHSVARGLHQHAGATACTGGSIHQSLHPHYLASSHQHPHPPHAACMFLPPSHSSCSPTNTCTSSAAQHRCTHNQRMLSTPCHPAAGACLHRSVPAALPAGGCAVPGLSVRCRQGRAAGRRHGPGQDCAGHRLHCSAAGQGWQCC